MIDRDYASALLARQLDADLFVISTAVECVYLFFGTPDRRPIREMTVAQARQYVEEGHFARGSMLPKIDFLQVLGDVALAERPSIAGLPCAAGSLPALSLPETR